MKRKSRRPDDELRAEYQFDYSKAVRGKYHRRLLKEGANVVVLEPDVARVFQDSAAVNDALRSLLEVTQATRRLTARSRRTAQKRAPDAWVAFQVLRYLVRIWEQALEQKVKKLPPIFPLVLYHGRARWRAARDFGALIEWKDAATL
jgi:hypothetical protein